MVYLLALVSATLYGAADFLGGLTARRADTIAVVIVSQFAGLVVLALMLAVLPTASATVGDLSWGAAAGLAGGVGVAVLYHGLAIGTMAVVAPTTGVCAVAIPVVAAVLLGDRPATLTWAGIVLALVAIVLVGQERTTAPAGRRPGAAGRIPTGVGLAFVAGVAIGLFFLLLSRARPDAGLWPLIPARVASVALFSILVLAGARRIRIAGQTLWLVVLAGALDMLANALYLLATHRGALSVVVTLASLYPASTVLLARIGLGERLNRLQISGVVCALAAIVMIVS